MSLLLPGNFTSAGLILTNDTLADRKGPWASPYEVMKGKQKRLFAAI